VSDDRLAVPGLTNDEQAWVDALWTRLGARLRRNLLRESYYDGKHAVTTVGTVIPPYLQSLGVVLGWTAKSVDMLARRCNLEGFYSSDVDLDDAGITELVESNNLYAELKAGLVSSLINGVSFAITTRGDDAAGEPTALVHVKDALNATGMWSPRTRSLQAVMSVAAWGKRDGQTTARPVAFTLYLDGLTVTCTHIGGADWVVDRQVHSWGVPVEPLVYKPRTGREFGSSRISRPQMALQDLAVRAVLRMEGHMDVYSVPQMWLLGADESIFKNADGSQKASWQIALGRMFGVPDDPDREDGLARADVKQFAAQSPQPHLAQLSALAKLFAREASLPDAAMAITDMANPTSADAYVAANDDLIAEAEGATDDWSLPLRRTVARALAIQNGDDGVPDDLSTLGVQWRSPMHVSRAAAADAGAKQIATVPWLAETEVGLELLGLSEDQRQRALAERRRAQGRTTLAAVLADGVTDADVE
jgi:hypothetical protein